MDSSYQHEEKFKQELRGLLKEISSIYSVSIKKINESQSAEQVVVVLRSHLDKVKDHSQKMLDLEITDPRRFKDHKTKPPPESKKLRKLAKNFSMHLARLSFKYGQNKSFQKAFEQIRSYRYDEEGTASKVGANLLGQKIRDMQRILAGFKDFPEDRLKQFLGSAIVDIKIYYTKSETFNKKYPNILEKQKNILNVSRKLNELDQRMLRMVGKISLKYKANKDITQRCSELRDLLSG